VRKIVFWKVFVDGMPKGEAWRDGRGRVWWQRPNGSKESYPPRANLLVDVREHVGRTCNVYANAVEFKKS
jgi:hypothetical protein